MLWPIRSEARAAKGKYGTKKAYWKQSPYRKANPFGLYTWGWVARCEKIDENVKQLMKTISK